MTVTKAARRMTRREEVQYAHDLIERAERDLDEPMRYRHGWIEASEWSERCDRVRQSLQQARVILRKPKETKP